MGVKIDGKRESDEKSAGKKGGQYAFIKATRLDVNVTEKRAEKRRERDGKKGGKEREGREK